MVYKMQQMDSMGIQNVEETQSMHYLQELVNKSAQYESSNKKTNGSELLEGERP